MRALEAYLWNNVILRREKSDAFTRWDSFIWIGEADNDEMDGNRRCWSILEEEGRAKQIELSHDCLISVIRILFLIFSSSRSRSD